MTISEFAPNWISPPGDTIADILRHKAISDVQFAEITGLSKKHVAALLAGRLAVTAEIATLIANCVGGSASFWVSREAQYRDDIARLEREGSRQASKAWLAELPVAEMVRLRWIDKQPDLEQQVKACLRFFAVPNVEAFRRSYNGLLSAVAFRSSKGFDSQPGSILAWLRQGELLSEQIECRRWSPVRFEGTLKQIRSLTRRKSPQNFLPELQRLCADCGVAFCVVRAPSGSKVSGATRFLAPSKAMMLVSFRYLSDDQFWFTFFHEAGHLLLHNRDALFLEDDSEATSSEEREANEFAESVLIPDKSELLELLPDREEIMRYSVKIGVSRGIVVGQLQHHGRVEKSKLNWLKRRYRWDDLFIQPLNRT